MPEPPEWPHALRAGAGSPPLERRGWQSSLAPQLIGLFLWVVYFDQIPARDARPRRRRSGRSSGRRSGACSVTCCFIGPRRCGGWRRAGRSAVIATSTFGVRGATWVPGLLLAVAAGRLAGRRDRLRDGAQPRGRWCCFGCSIRATSRRCRSAGERRRAFLFLVTSLLWCFAAAFVGRYLVRVIAALMNVFPVVPARHAGGDGGPGVPGLAGLPRGRRR